MSPQEIRMSLCWRDIMPLIFSAGLPDKESNCDKLNESVSASADSPETVPEKRPLRDLGSTFDSDRNAPRLLGPVRPGGGMYNV